MDPLEMLKTLSEYGEEAGEDFNDGDDVMGWFSWAVAGEGKARQLTITYRPEEDGEAGAPQTASWVLVPMFTDKDGKATFAAPGQPG